MTHRTSRITMARTIGLTVVAALAIVTACEARLPTSSEVQAMDVASAEKAMLQSKMLDERAAANLVYVVNGETMTAEQAHGIPSDRIATVNVLKGARNAEGAYGPSVVRITTADTSVRRGVHFEAGQPMVKTTHGPPLGKTKFDGLLFVDGVRAPGDALTKLNSEQIASIDILKGEAAHAMYSDPAAANGVIKVTTKAAAKTTTP